jgi:3-hydroxybutyryl-CoA dehydrogenase
MTESRQITVVGMGTMGHGIAHVAAAAGFTVRAHDVAAELIEKGLAAIRANLDKGVEKGKVTEGERDATLTRLHPAPDLAVAAAESFLIIEAAPESAALKREIFAELERNSSVETVLASNTSSIPIGKIAAATRRPGRVVGMHFFNPVHLMPLIEVVRADTTSDATLARAVEVGREMGKEPIVVADSPGFATSRLGVALGLEAMRMVEQGVASVEDIDKAMTLGYRHPMGPLRLTDLVGLDVRLAIAENLFSELESDAFRPPEILERMVDEGHLGKKTGRGFYRW